MRKQLLLAALLLTTVKGFAGSIDYLSQQDAEYFAHPSMTGKIGVSGAYYNPAGTAFMENGTYMQINNQTHLKTYKMKIDGETFKSDKPSPIIPSFQLVHVNNGRSFFFHGGAIAGGGNVAYEGGLGMFKTMENKLNAVLPGNPVTFTGGNTVKGSSYYVTLQGGMAQRINDEWSFAVGVRYVNAERKLRGVGNYSLNIGPLNADPRFDINSERTAQGVTGIFGVDYKPSSKLNFAFRYETETRLNFKTKEKNLHAFQGSFGIFNKIPNPQNPSSTLGQDIAGAVVGDKNVKEWTDGARGKRNLPAMASLGTSYAITEKTTLLASGNYYFIKEAGDTFGAYDDYHNGYEVAVGIDHQLNEKWTLMTGYQYTNTGANKHTYKDTDYALDADMFGLGAKYKYSENLDLMATGATVLYHSATSVTNVKYSKHVYSIGLGATYKFN
ncbi:MAG: OmpP1/FadL family transporter [Cetobacterium sp.]|uniref:OmpP1/FadL family transporter n=1 Tax=Cetobacterium sp. TaxID=2071632 RepID=UPI003F3081F6